MLRSRVPVAVARFVREGVGVAVAETVTEGMRGRVRVAASVPVGMAV